LTTLVSGHKTGYQIAYLSINWSPYFIFATAPCCIKRISCFCSIFRQTTSTG